MDPAASFGRARRIDSPAPLAISVTPQRAATALAHGEQLPLAEAEAAQREVGSVSREALQDTRLRPYRRACVVVCAVVTLVLTILLLLDAVVICADLRRGDYCADNDCTCNWFAYFAVSVVECTLVILHLLHHIWRVLHALRKGDGVSSPLLDSAAAPPVLLLHRTHPSVWLGAVLNVFAFYTVVLYLSYFINPVCSLLHLTMHVRCISLCLLRCVCYALFSLLQF